MSLLYGERRDREQRTCKGEYRRRVRVTKIVLHPKVKGRLVVYVRNRSAKWLGFQKLRTFFLNERWDSSVQGHQVVPCALFNLGPNRGPAMVFASGTEPERRRDDLFRRLPFADDSVPRAESVARRRTTPDYGGSLCEHRKSPRSDEKEASQKTTKHSQFQNRKKRVNEGAA